MIMGIYVDNMKCPVGRMVMCHMLADTPAELRSMAESIGVDLKWIQNPGTYREHLDICRSKKQEAVRRGAKEITVKETGAIIRAKRAGSCPRCGSMMPANFPNKKCSPDSHDAWHDNFPKLNEEIIAAVADPRTGVYRDEKTDDLLIVVFNPDPIVLGRCTLNPQTPKEQRDWIRKTFPDVMREDASKNGRIGT